MISLLELRMDCAPLLGLLKPHSSGAFLEYKRAEYGQKILAAMPRQLWNTGMNLMRRTYKKKIWFIEGFPDE